jgi:hypothetical protein
MARSRRCKKHYWIAVECTGRTYTVKCVFCKARKGGGINPGVAGEIVIEEGKVIVKIEGKEPREQILNTAW